MSANRDQIRHWNEVAGVAWVDHQERLDQQLHAHGERALAAAAPRPGERVLDVGCGCGATSLELARCVGDGGHVTGVDVSAPMLARARDRAAAAGLAQVAFVEADAQQAELPAGFDLVFSRFGVMFFDDAAAAFANLQRALAPGGRLAFACWQTPSANPWVTVPMAAVAPLLELPPPPAPEAPGMFSLADAGRVERLLAGAGFADVRLADVRLPMRPAGGGLEAAVRFFLEVGPVSALLREQDASASLRARVRDALRTALAPYAEGRAEFASAMWLVRARRSG